MNPIQDYLAKHPLLLLDGAFSTELERRGCDLKDPLWSAKILMENPSEVSAVHEDYYRAGAACVITASYQATFEGFAKRGLSEQQATELMRSSVSLAREAAERVMAERENGENQARPLVAASIGPYGAYLADGSEYRGDYGIDESELIKFHRKRLALLVDSQPDVLACETIPCLIEARALARLMAEHPAACCWISFSARDGIHTNNGEKLVDCARALDGFEQVAAVGINCTAPEHIDSLIGEIKKGTDKPVIVYPNGGERYNPFTKCWEGGKTGHSFADLAAGWYQKGARIIGGCCRTSPQDIRRISSWAKTLPGETPS